MNAAAGPRSHRWIVIALAALGAVVLAAFLLVRWALDPNTLKPIAEARLTAALGQPVTIGSVRLSLFPSLSVTGSNIRVGGDARAPGTSLDLGTVRLHPRLSTIFRRPIVVDRIEIVGLSLNARRDASGRLMLPLPDPRLASSSAGSRTEAAALDVAEVLLRSGRLTIANASASGSAPLSALTVIDNIIAAVHHVDTELRLDRLSASVGRSRVTGSGTIGATGLGLRLAWTNLSPGDLPFVFALLGTTAPAGLAVEGKTPLVLDLVIDAAGQVSASGKVRADTAALGTVTMTRFESPVRFGRDRLTLAPMTFRAYSGTGAGRVNVTVATTPATWTLDGALQGIDIDQFLSANTSARGKVSGRAALKAQLRGTSASPMTRSMFGTANVTVTDGAVHDFRLLAALYSALRLGAPSGRDLRFQSLTGTFTIADQRATTSDLTIRTGELTLTAAGTITFDQALALDGTARFSPAKSAELIRSVRELSSLTNAAGEIEVPLRVRGTAGAPQFSIDAWSMIRRGAQQELKKRLGDKLREIFKKK
jgi:uncharacterized protein involved in outer membrane biogenesis